MLALFYWECAQQNVTRVESAYLIRFIIERVNMLICSIFYGIYKCANDNFKDPLQRSFMPDLKNHDLDGWSVSHFLFYMLSDTCVLTQ